MNYTRLLVWKLSSPLFFKYRFLKGQKEPWRERMNWKQIVTVTFCPLSSPCHFWQLGHYFPFPVKDCQGLKKAFQSFAFVLICRKGRKGLFILPCLDSYLCTSFFLFYVLFLFSDTVS